MKQTIYKIVALLLLVGCCLTALPVSVFAEPEDEDWSYDEGETYPEETETVTEPVPEESPVGAFTPSGNLTLVDDYYKIEGIDENGNVASKQFLTLQSKDGNYFYLVIDRFGATENVYFLNLVDEAALMTLIEGESNTSPVQCTCSSKCVAGKVNTSCPICKKNMSECVGKADEKEVTEPTEPAPITTPADQTTQKFPVGIVVLVIAVAGVGGAIYFIKAKKKKNAVVDPDGFDEVSEAATVEEADEN